MDAYMGESRGNPHGCFSQRKPLMNEPPDIPDLTPLIRRRGRRNYRERSGIRESIETSRSALLINLIIEVVSSLILVFAVAYTVIFLYHRREMLDPGRFKLYIEILTFFIIGMFTWIGFKIRRKILALKQHWNPSPLEPPEEKD
jgi:hypothetical protein